MDERGWYRREKLRMVVGWWLFVVMDWLYKGLYFVTKGRIYMPLQGRVGQIWLTFASWGYLYTDWRRGDLPENGRIGGVWT